MLPSIFCMPDPTYPPPNPHRFPYQRIQPPPLLPLPARCDTAEPEILAEANANYIMFFAIELTSTAVLLKTSVTNFSKKNTPIINYQLIIQMVLSQNRGNNIQITH